MVKEVWRVSIKCEESSVGSVQGNELKQGCKLRL